MCSVSGVHNLLCAQPPEGAECRVHSVECADYAVGSAYSAQYTMCSVHSVLGAECTMCGVQNVWCAAR